MQRACAAAILHQDIAEIIHPGHSQDDLAAIDVITKLGAQLQSQPDRLVVNSAGVRPLSPQIDCGESGLGIRMFTPIAALSDQPLVITGRGSLVTRPMDFFDQIFPQLGIRIQSNEGRLPLQVHGPMQPGNIEVDGSLSSQFLTGLLMAYSAAGARDVEIKVRDLKSKPYIDLTLDVMKAFGMQVPENRDYASFYYPAASRPVSPGLVRYAVEGDWSGASFLIVAAAIAGDTVIEGLQKDSSQADKAILLALDAAGVEYSWKNDDLHVHQSQIRNPKPVPRDAGSDIPNLSRAMRDPKSLVRAFSFNATECPDLFPPLVALAAYADGISTISGASRLTHKESNRALTLQEEFGKLGLRIDLDGDRMHIHGGGPLQGGHVHSRHDHRIAMALAVAGLRAEGPVVIEEAQAIGKSYPDFYTDLQALGANLDVQQAPITEKTHP
jgi:3-phosphoshikimate 1-carboxyvinyltransferase